MSNLALSDRQRREKWIYIISLVTNSHVFENYFEQLFILKPDTVLIFLNEKKSFLQLKCEEIGFKTVFIRYKSKKNIVRASFNILQIFLREKPNLVHTHLFDASITGISIAWFMGIKKRIHTRHHGPQHHNYHPHAVSYDRWINKRSTFIFAISENIKELLIQQEGVNKDKIAVVHHGFNFQEFDLVDEIRIEKLKGKYSIQNRAPVIGMISRYTEWKGIQYVIPAFKKLLYEYPDAVLLLANAKGEYKDEISVLLESLPKDSFREIVFEDDSPALFKLFNVFVHVPIDSTSEAFGQVYIEALASGVPCVFTISGIANEFVSDKNSLIVPYCDSDSIFLALKNILENKEAFKQRASVGKIQVGEMFSVQTSLNKVIEGYGK
jgi:glycosyltransferase involved in cell wall biosynthesis